MAREMGVLKLGTVALDGTKIHANASRHSALSYEHASKIEAQLQAEVAYLLRKAEATDQADAPDGMQVPEELARRDTPERPLVKVCFRAPLPVNSPKRWKSQRLAVGITAAPGPPDRTTLPAK
jgi:hypothetical protein